MAPCTVCGGTRLTDLAVVWNVLAERWGISAEECMVVDRQQGTCCTGRGGNLLSIALGGAILAEYDWDGRLRDFVTSEQARTLRLLEVNEAGTLSPTLWRRPGHVFGAYPEFESQMIYDDDGIFNQIMHSDTLEHVPDPAPALHDRARVLPSGGALCFSAPVIPGRMSASRAGLPPLHHGDPVDPTDDLLVHTDYRADVRHLPHQAGFAAVPLSCLDDGFTITASRRIRRPKVTRAATPSDPARAQLDAVLDSTSWRISAPLRAAIEAWRRPTGGRR